jgi:GAF domain-containing protein
MLSRHEEASGGGVELPKRSAVPPAPDAAFDRFASLVTRELDVPVGLVSFPDVEGQALAGAAGLSEPWLSERWTPISHSFCQHVLTTEEPLLVENANDDLRVWENLGVMELGVIAYAGMPLRGQDGTVLGSMCAIDHRPRLWTDHELTSLTELAAACSDEIGRREAADPDRFS